MVLLLGTAITATACGGGGDSAQPSATTRPGSPSSPSGRSSTATTSTSPSPGATARSSCVSRVLAGMTTSQRVGQLFVSAVSTSGPTGTELAVLRRNDIGSVILMGHTTTGTTSSGHHPTCAVPRPDSGRNPGRSAGVGRPGGRSDPGTRWPRLLADAQRGRSGQLAGLAVAAERHRVGPPVERSRVSLNLAPVVDVVPADQTAVNQPIVSSRGYGHTASTVARQSSAFVRGMKKAGELTTLKHFPSLGHVRGNTDFSSNITDNVTRSNGEFIETYRSGIQAGARFVMIALVTYTKIDPHHLAIFSPTVVRTLLRDRIGFGGVVISDDLGKAVAVRSIPAGQRATGFLSSGGDMVLTVAPPTVDAMTSAVLTKVKTDPAFRKSVDASVRRVLAAKISGGLLTCPR